MRIYKILLCSALLIGALACADSEPKKVNVAAGDPFADHEDDNINVIGVDNPHDNPTSGDGDGDGDDVPESPVLVGSFGPDPGDVEVCATETLCTVPPVDESGWCEREGGPVDLIYVDGVLVDTICYPPADDAERPVETVTDASGDIDVAQNANNTTVVFDEATDGVPLVGDIVVDGNNVAIYGNGPDSTIIDGNVSLDGNNARLRGVTITGDLILSKNNVAIVLTRILGNVQLSGTATNNSVFAENEIFGSFTSDSNNNILVGNAVLGEFAHTGNNNVCDRNYAFDDLDADQSIDEGEAGDPLNCD
jgi:hypothetical protein